MSSLLGKKRDAPDSEEKEKKDEKKEEKEEKKVEPEKNQPEADKKPLFGTAPTGGLFSNLGNSTQSGGLFGNTKKPLFDGSSFGTGTLFSGSSLFSGSNITKGSSLFSQIPTNSTLFNSAKPDSDEEGDDELEAEVAKEEKKITEVLPPVESI